MTPKEKAGELFNKYHKACNATIAGASTLFLQIAKKCALISVDEILKICPAADAFNVWRNESEPTFVEYWQQVKTEIKNL